MGDKCENCNDKTPFVEFVYFERGIVYNFKRSSGAWLCYRCNSLKKEVEDNYEEDEDYEDGKYETEKYEEADNCESEIYEDFEEDEAHMLEFSK